MDELPLFSRVRNYGEKVAISNTTSQFTYKQLLTDSAALASTLLGDEADLNEARIAFLAPGGPEYAIIQWGIWRAGGTATPLCLSAAEPEFEYTLTDSEANRVIATREQANKVASVCERLEIPLLVLEDLRLVSEK